MKITTVGIDLAKNLFSMHGIDGHGKAELKRTVSRGKVMAVMAGIPPCLVGVEACSEPTTGFANWAVSGHTARINQLRGLLSEFGIVMPKGRYKARRELPAVLDDAQNGLPVLAREALSEVHERIRHLDAQMLADDRRIETMARESAAAQRLMAIAGIGPVTATALVVTVGHATEFKNGRQFAAWLGLVQRQYSTGGKTRLRKITKQGDVYLRMLLVHGARAANCHHGRRQQRHIRKPYVELHVCPPSIIATGTAQ